MISTIEKVLFLKGVDLFRSIASEELATIASIAEIIEIEKDHTIFNEGDKGDAMYLIVRGRVKVHSKTHTLAELDERQCFGEMALLDDNEQRSAAITALTELLLLKIMRDDFIEILSEKSEIAIGVIKVLTRRLREANKR